MASWKAALTEPSGGPRLVVRPDHSAPLLTGVNGTPMARAVCWPAAGRGRGAGIPSHVGELVSKRAGLSGPGGAPHAMNDLAH